jgi:hypothetical protein
MPSRTRVVYEGRPATAAALAGLAGSPWTWATQAVTFWSVLSLAVLAGASPRRSS